MSCKIFLIISTVVTVSAMNVIQINPLRNEPTETQGNNNAVLFRTKEEVWSVKSNQRSFMDQNYDVMFLIQDKIDIEKHFFAKSLAGVVSKEMGFEERLFEIGNVNFLSDGTTHLQPRNTGAKMDDTYRHLPFPSFINKAGCGAHQRKQADFILLSSISPIASRYDTSDEIFKDQITIVITEGCQFCNSIHGNNVMKSVGSDNMDALLIIAVNPSRVCKRRLQHFARSNKKFEVITLRDWVAAVRLSQTFPVTSPVIREKLWRLVRSRKY